MRKSFEHSIWGPIGFAFSAEQGKVAPLRNDVDFNQLAHSFPVGLTLRARGLPAFSLAFALGAQGDAHHCQFGHFSSWRIGPPLSLLIPSYDSNARYKSRILNDVDVSYSADYVAAEAHPDHSPPRYKRINLDKGLHLDERPRAWECCRKAILARLHREPR